MPVRRGVFSGHDCRRANGAPGCAKAQDGHLNEPAAKALASTEGVLDEFKTHLRANSTVLRSKTPDLVQQELWGLLLAHFAIRQLMAQAAWDRGLDPDRLSFSHAVRVIKRKMPQAAALPP